MNSVFFSLNNNSSSGYGSSTNSYSSASASPLPREVLKTGSYTFTIVGPVNDPKSKFIIEQIGEGVRYSREDTTLEEGVETVRSWDTHIVNTNNNPTAQKKSRLVTVKEDFEKWLEGLKKKGGARRKQTLYRKKSQRRKTRKPKRK